MRTLLLAVLAGLFSNLCYTQVNEPITEKRNIYNNKGNYYFDRNEFEKAIVYYNMAYVKDTDDYYSILKKAESYTKLKLYPQAEECYRTVFGSNRPLDNAYRLKYALVLLTNNKQKEFKYWLDLYSQQVDEEIKGENYLVSSEKRIQLYKDTSLVLITPEGILDTIDFKIKYAGYRPRNRALSEDKKLILLLGSGEEYAVDASGENTFTFSFMPMENYRFIIQRENIKGDDIINNDQLTSAQKRTLFLNPPPVQKAEIKLQPGIKYQFTSGQNNISTRYLSNLKELSNTYQTPGESIINLTALVKELHLRTGEIYTIRFVKDEIPDNSNKKIEVSTLFLNNQEVRIYSQSFFGIVPVKSEMDFTIQTNIDIIEKDFSSKKYTIIIDDSPVFKEEEDAMKWLVSLMVNTDSIEEVNPFNHLSAIEISVIPETEYILTLSKPDPTNAGKKIEVIVPLTKGVKYNLSSTQKNDAEFKEALAEFFLSREGLELTNEEVIDISVLSKELEVQPGEDLTFTLLPVRQFNNKPAASEESKLRLTLDGKNIDINRDEKYTINIPFNPERTINFQTDMDYIQENFEGNDITLRLDTISFTSEIVIDTTGLGNRKSSGWLVSMNINTDSVEEVEKQNQFIATEVSIIPGKEYILTVSKFDGETGKKIEIIVPLSRNVKYDFTANPASEESYTESLNNFLAGRNDIETIDGEVIDIRLISKELQIKEGDEISFSLLPVRELPGIKTVAAEVKSSLYLDNKLVEFIDIQKFTINVPLSSERQMNMQTDLGYIQENYTPGSYNVDVDTLSFFSEITIDTTGYNYQAMKEDMQIKDPVYDVITVNFDLNEHILRPAAKTTIQENVIEALKNDSRLYVTIKGYTDALGDADYNLALSKKRAEAVKDYLTNNGIGENRIRTFSYGASQLLEENINWKDMDETELRKYRKVEIVIYLPE